MGTFGHKNVRPPIKNFRTYKSANVIKPYMILRNICPNPDTELTSSDVGLPPYYCSSTIISGWKTGYGSVTFLGFARRIYGFNTNKNWLEISASPSPMIGFLFSVSPQLTLLRVGLGHSQPASELDRKVLRFTTYVRVFLGNLQCNAVSSSS